MATVEEVNKALQLFQDNNPKNIFDEMRRTEAGILAVLKILYMSEGNVRSKDISDQMGVSSARMAKLLKKMELKNLIIKKMNPADCRETIIELTEHGEVVMNKVSNHMYITAEKIIDDIGMDELEKMFVSLNKLKKYMFDNTLDLMEL